MFISKRKLIKILREKQLEISLSNQSVKEKYIKEKNMQKARDMQLYEDGNDNAFNYIIYLLQKRK